MGELAVIRNAGGDVQASNKLACVAARAMQENDGKTKVQAQG